MIGVNATLYKSLAFAFSGVFVAMAGTLYAAWVHYIEPPDVYDVVMSVCSRIVVLHNGALIADGTPSEVVADHHVVEAYLGKKYAQAATAGA